MQTPRAGYRMLNMEYGMNQLGNETWEQNTQVATKKRAYFRKLPKRVPVGEC